MLCDLHHVQHGSLARYGAPSVSVRIGLSIGAPRHRGQGRGQHRAGERKTGAASRQNELNSKLNVLIFSPFSPPQHLPKMNF